MAQIKVLPEQLINQIAAGEVVERPASVVKELLENAVDAKATQIIVEIRDAGQSLIRIIDDGVGMDRDDAILALERHATSKISSLEDMNLIRTMGFRGEAIASIASVSRLIIKTKRREEVAGTVVESEGGKVLKVEHLGLKDGTQIEVHDLFFNTPARQKYLKTEDKEFKATLDVMIGAALSFPHISFRLIHNEEQVFDFPPAQDDLVRIRSVWGNNITQELIPVMYQGVHIHLQGYVGKPLIARSSKNMQYIFVNDREIKSHVLAYAVKQAYHSLLPKEKQPVFVLKFDLHPSLVDVNVHPRKSEVKFLDEREIFRIVTAAVQKSLEKHVLAPKIRADQPANYYTDREAQGIFQVEDQTIAMKTPAEIYRLDIAAQNQEMAMVAATEAPSSFTIRLGIHEEMPPVQQDIYQLEFHEEENKGFEERTQQLDIVPLVQINNAYLLCAQGKSLVIVDQHAAHERVKYTEIQKFFEEKEKVIQQLLTPIQVELTHQESHVLNSNKEILDGLGFEISHFGGNTFSIMAVPSLLIRHNPEKTLRGIIDDLTSGELAKGDFQARIEKIITIMACRSAVKFGDPLSREEQMALIEQLQQVPLPYTCPHGRPTMIIMTDEELRERFGRKYC